MTPERLLKHFNRITDAPNAISSLRSLVLDLAVRGKLVPPSTVDEPARDLLTRIAKQQERVPSITRLKQAADTDANQTSAVFAIPDSWQWVRLIDLLVKFTDGTHHSPSNHSTGDFMYVTAKNIKPEGISLDEITYIDANDHQEIYARCDPRKGDILYVKDGATTGVVTINDLDEQFSLLSSVALIRLADGLFNRLIVAFLRSPFFYNQMRGFMKGAAITRLTLKRMAPALLPLPPLAEQRRIVATVDELMALCDQLEAAQAERKRRRDRLAAASLARLNQPVDDSGEFRRHIRFHLDHLQQFTTRPDQIPAFRQTILNLAFRGRLVLQDAGEQSAFELVNCIRKVKLELLDQKSLRQGATATNSIDRRKEIDLPSSWKWVKCDDIFFVTKLAGFEYSKHFEVAVSGEVPVVRAQNVRPGSLDRSNLRYIDKQTSELLYRSALTKPSLLVTFIGAGIGDVAVFEEPARWHLAPNVAKMEPFSGCEEWINLRYLVAFMNSPFGRGELFKHMKVTAQPSLSMGTLRDIDIPLAPLAEQARIVAKIDELMAICNELESLLTTFDTDGRRLLEAVLHEALAPAAPP